MGGIGGLLGVAGLALGVTALANDDNGTGTPIVPGEARGLALVADTPLSFWGGYNPETGEIIDQRHPLAGEMAAGRVLVIPAGRGSCSGSGVLLESIVYQTAPAAIITSSPSARHWPAS